MTLLNHLPTPSHRSGTGGPPPAVRLVTQSASPAGRPTTAPSTSALSVFAPVGGHGTPRLHVDRLDLPPGAVEASPESQSQIDAAARSADVVRLRHSAAVPSDGALARVIGLLEDALAEAGRRRSQVRVALELQVAVVADAPSIARKRTELSHLDALSGLSWSPSATWVVTTAERLVNDVLDAAEHLDVDDVLLIPLGERAAAAIR